MKPYRLRLSALLWLVAVVAAFLAGIRYGEYRAEARRPKSLDAFDAVEMIGADDSSVSIIPASGP
jgi:hypothetical protein